MFKKVAMIFVLVCSMLLSAIPALASNVKESALENRHTEAELTQFEVSVLSERALLVRATVQPGGYFDTNSLYVAAGDSYYVDALWTSGAAVEIVSIDSAYPTTNHGTFTSGSFLRRMVVTYGGYSSVFYRLYNRSNSSISIVATIYR